MRQSKKEVLLTLAAFFGFFAVWTGTYFGLGAKTETYILGMPAWFFYGAVIGTFAFVAAVFVIVRFGFRDDAEAEAVKPAEASSAAEAGEGGER